MEKNEDIKVLLVIKLATGEMPTQYKEKFLSVTMEQVRRVLDSIDGMKILCLPTKTETDIYAIPLKAMMDGNISGHDEDVELIIEKCKSILNEKGE